MKKALAAVLLVLLSLFVLAPLSPDVGLTMPQEKTAADPEQESDYSACVAQRDAEIHRTAFATIDNPDVQREYLATHKDRAKRACREEYPEQWLTIREPGRIHFFGLDIQF